MTDVATMNPPPTPPDPAWLNAVLKLGVLPALLLYLVWFITGGISGRFDTLEAAALEQKATDSALIQLFRQVCWNTADTQSELAGCGVGR